MSLFRWTLLGFSTLSALVLLAFWTVSGRSADIVLFVVLAFLIANIFYILVSRPTIGTSDILARASTGFALASLELQHQAQEARAREEEADKRRLAEAEQNRYKLQVARDMLQLMRPKFSLDQNSPTGSRQISYAARSEQNALPSPLSVPQRGNDLRHVNGHGPAEKPSQSVARAEPPASTTIN